MPKKILVVDDERSIVWLVEANLQKAGYEVICAYDGAKAFTKVTSERPDIVICDDLMPEMDGYELLEKLREVPATGGIPVIMVLENGTIANAFRCSQLGASYVLWKGNDKVPNIRELLIFIDRIFRDPPDDPNGESGGAPVRVPVPVSSAPGAAKRFE